MAEWASEVCVALSTSSRIVVDSRDADHEAGDLIQAGLNVANYPTLADVITSKHPAPAHCEGGVFFHNCGWAGWDLAAARCAVKHLSPH